MTRSLIVVGLIVAVTSEALAGQRYFPSSGSGMIADDYTLHGYGYGRQFGANDGFKNAPGGAYIECDPRNPSSPVRCKPDGW